MKKLLFLFAVWVFLAGTGYTQIHQIVFNHTPPPVAVVSAGPDTMISWGSTYVLPANVTGGTAPFTYLWQPGTYLNDSTILNPVFTVPATGIPAEVLTFTVTDSKGCVSTDQVTINTYINFIGELDSPPIKVFPNPSQGLILIEGLPSTEGETVVSCYSLPGGLLFRRALTSSGGTLEIDLRPVVPGFYMLSVQHGDHRYMQKIVIQ
jgi:hypothetical protein